MRLTLQDEESSQQSFLINNNFLSTIFIHPAVFPVPSGERTEDRGARCGKHSDSLDIEVLQEDSQTLTCSLYCEFAGTVHLIKRETCERALSTMMGYFGNFMHGSKL